MSAKVRVLVVDDSALMRKLIPQILATDNSIEVVGTAIDGNFGLKKIDELKPQVVTLDLEMPGMGGLDTLKEIMRRYRVPVIVVSSHSTSGASVTLKALSLGAFDFVAKPNDDVRRPLEKQGRARTAANADRGHWNFDRWTTVSATHALAIAVGFFRKHCRSATHA